MLLPIAYELDAFMLGHESVDAWWNGLSANARACTTVDLENRFIKQIPHVHPRSFVSDQAILQGGIIVSEGCYIGPTAVIRLDEKPDLEPLVIQADSNLQEGSCVHDNTHHIGQRVIVAHHAVVHGSYVEDEVTLYIKSCADVGSRLGKGAFLDAYSYVGRGVHIPEGRHVPPMTAVMTQAQADALAPVPAGHHSIREGVLAKNIGHSVEYPRYHK